MNETVVTYTSAPASFDYPYTKDMGVVAKDSKGRDIRKVVTASNKLKIQLGRYWSGAIYVVADEAEFKKLVDFKLVTLVEV